MGSSGSLRLAPISYLCAGMKIEEDIYNYMGNLLIRAGSRLDAALIEKVRDANNRQSYIYISEKMLKLWQEQKAASAPRPEAVAGVTVSKLRERETGYAGIIESSAVIFGEPRYVGTPMEKAPALALADEISRLLGNLKARVVFGLVNAVAPTEEYLQRHSANVSLLNGLFGRWLGLPREEAGDLVLTGLLHDVGKTMVPREILSAQRELLTFELEVMKMHTEYGERLLGGFPAPIRAGVRFHHEKADGTGYPRGRKAADIPLAARVTAVSDIYDAMVSSRVYRTPQSPFAALAGLAAMRGKSLDPRLVDLFLRKMPMELLGGRVLLQNGETAQIERIDYADIANPFIALHGETVKSGGELTCVSMCAM